MSENNKQQLISTLRGLNREEQAWVINFLVQNLAGLSFTKRKARKLHHDEMTDEQWEEYFAGKDPIELPHETVSLNEILTNTAGKTIKPIEKWL